HIFLHSVVVGRRFPVLGEEYHAHCLTEVVELQTGATDGGHDRSIRDELTFDAEFARPKNQVCVCSRSDDLLDSCSLYPGSKDVRCIPKRIADYQECDIRLICPRENVIAATFD